ncbi:MAG TPA: hypothetical protein VIY49_07995 [Bryobacteraceae bacterium]
MSVHEQLAALGALAAILIAIAARIALQGLRRNPERRERRRRLHVNRTGRLGDALITEVSGELVYYTYSVHGVHYSASQDIAALREKLPPELGPWVGLANIKYSRKNPANSILVCEEWSGLRKGSARSAAGAQ